MQRAPSPPLILSSEHDTRALAQSLAPLLEVGDILLLQGEIGAGKSFFSRCLIRALTHEAQEVPSPTFTLVQTYDAPDFEIWHADLYRLSHPDEAGELGLTDAFETGLCLIEWPDRLGDLTPPDALLLDFRQGSGESDRILDIHATGPRAKQLRAQLQSFAP
ncbi:tRNA threonylcarbamoyladenosine biosynthesis protein TsaE [Aquimixticola soesokkakensis]|uniref:tRNA threonylcarbamoyladenosine biosynthesis protein TsaE n=1 Tax=Aquimixticola soesokkakensis TaxID=1519096 RepID=A0A1Y5R994_9RHOB|nr:tRNA (adenosine(37)-N6)-threonylcarbamoyltransferase complex ATPase subunit type 1 TsaE [Aquimixticola soesokkakensis]SLN12095.1 tRNA threonylcarbamoyladenosine biosynthesis protein TsaE [Aquimixticola soesokkakensis]